MQKRVCEKLCIVWVSFNNHHKKTERGSKFRTVRGPRSRKRLEKDRLGVSADVTRNIYHLLRRAFCQCVTVSKIIDLNIPDVVAI